LERYQFNPSKTASRKNKTSPQFAKIDLPELWEKFTEFKTPQIEQTTLLSKYGGIKTILETCPFKKMKEAPKIREWALANLTHYTAWNFLLYLHSCCNWAKQSGIIADNPFGTLRISKPKKKSTDLDYRAYTLKQRDLIIQTFETHPVHSHYAPLVKFLFWTGCRPGEAFALTWDDISADCTKISISKSCNSYRLLKGTKNGKKRSFPTTSGGKLHQLLLSMRKTARTKLIFCTPRGGNINSSHLSDAWLGKNTGKYKYPGVVGALAAEGKVPYLVPYSCRHTFATWAISSGISPDKVALWIGDTVQTVLKYYCHPEIVEAECPDF